MFRATVVRRLAAAAKPASSAPAAQSTGGNMYVSQYRTKKVWPPDYSKLSPQAQLRLEKKYKRRVALLSAQPRWDRFVKVARLVAVVSIVAYFTLFFEVDDENENPFFTIKQWFWAQFGVKVSRDPGGPRKSSAERPEFNEHPR